MTGYIGRSVDAIDNISTLDNLSFNGSLQTFNLTQNSAAFTPVSADALQIQIDGVIQANNFTISGSSLTFDVVPSGSSVCNSVKHFGVGLLTQPSTGSVGINELSASGTKSSSTFLAGDNSFKSLTTNATHSGEVTGATALTIADNIVDEANLKVSNSAVNGYMLTAQSGNTGGLTWAAASSNAPYFLARRSNTGQTVANDTYVTILFDTEMLDSASTYNTGTGLWTPSTAGKYFMFAQVCFAVNAGTDWDSATIIMDKNSAGYTDTNFKNSMAHITRRSGGSSTDSFYVSQIVDLDDNDTMRIQFQGGWSGSSSNQTVGYGKTYFGGYKLA
jgi:hypothetical protein